LTDPFFEIRFIDSSSPCHGVRLPTHKLAALPVAFGGNKYVPIHAFHLLSLLTSCPLLEACLVDVVAAGSFAPDYLLVLRFEFCEANGAVAVDGFALAGMVVVGAGFVFRTERGVLKYFAEFLDLLSKCSQRDGWRYHTEEINASWYCRCSGAFRTLWRTWHASVFGTGRFYGSGTVRK